MVSEATIIWYVLEALHSLCGSKFWGAGIFVTVMMNATFGLKVWSLMSALIISRSLRPMSVSSVDILYQTAPSLVSLFETERAEKRPDFSKISSSLKTAYSIGVTTSSFSKVLSSGQNLKPMCWKSTESVEHLEPMKGIAKSSRITYFFLKFLLTLK